VVDIKHEIREYMDTMLLWVKHSESDNRKEIDTVHLYSKKQGISRKIQGWH
jgi:hypothetical protein